MLKKKNKAHRTKTPNVETLGVKKPSTKPSIETLGVKTAREAPPTKENVFKSAYKKVILNKKALIFLIPLFASVIFYPTNLEKYQEKERTQNQAVHIVEDYIRHINPIAQAVIPIILFDKIGLVQAVYIGLSTTITVHFFKRLYNNVYINGIRLGERPSRPTSKHNMPSGHSAAVSAATAFIILRYGWKSIYFTVINCILIIISLLTMYGRVLLKDHTLSAVIAGGTLGIIVALFLTSKYETDNDS